MPPEQDIVALIVAAGSGNRAGGDIPKQYARLGGKSVLAHSVDAFRKAGIDRVRVVIGPGQDALYQEALADRPLAPPIAGGATRQESVRNGLEAIVAEGDARAVLVHDAARPFVSAAVLERLLSALGPAEGAVPVLPLVDSLARDGGRLGDAVSRDNLVRVQTPQAFSFKAILDAHRPWTGVTDATDDAQVLRAAGFTVVTVAGDEALEKITHQPDFARAEARLASMLVSRVGFGFDVHAFAEGESLWLGGIQIPHSRGLKGHSDADVVLHAVTDALPGAIAAGDIGDHFPPSDPQWRGAPSSIFLDHARRLIERGGGRIDFIDVTIICEAPRIGPHRDDIRSNIAGLLGLPASRVSVKATTTERLGFTGRGEGIAAQAVATIRAPEEA